MPKFRVDTYEITKYFAGERSYSHSNYFDVMVDNVEQIKNALKLLNIEIFEIKQFSEEDSYRGEIVERSQILDEIDKEHKKKSEDYNANMKRMCNEYNDLPEVLEKWTFGEVEIRLMRGNIHYKPGYSSRNQGGPSFDIYINGKRFSEGFWLGNFIYSDGRRTRRTAFVEAYARRFGVLVANQISSNLLMMYKTREEIRKKYRIG